MKETKIYYPCIEHPYVEDTNWYLKNPCPGQSTGRAGVVFRNLINTLIASQCALASPCLSPIDFAPMMINACSECETTFDFIVVGAGTAGSVVANRLSEILPWTVLLIEAGADPPITTEVPKFYLSLQSSCIDWKFTTEKDEGMYYGFVDNRNKWPAGKVLGGSSTIGRMIINRGSPIDYDIWEKAGNPGWGFSDVINYFRKYEDFVEYDFLECPDIVKYHSTNDYITIGKFNSKEPLIPIIKEAAKELGYKNIHDPDGRVQAGFFSTYATIRDGERVSSAKAYLRVAKERTNLFILKNSKVNKILIDSSKRAYGVEYVIRNEKQSKVAKARKEVIVCAGVINTPKLLMLSGIGPEKHLKEVGIPVIKDLNVGCNLQDHVTFPGVVIALNQSKMDWVRHGALDSAYEYLSRRAGHFATIHESEVLGFIGINDDDIPDIQLFPYYIRKRDFKALYLWAQVQGFTMEIIDLYEKILNDIDILVMHPVLLRPYSRGKVKLQCKDPDTPPSIYAGHLRSSFDLEAILSGIKFIERLAQTSQMRRHDADIKRLNFPGCCNEEFLTDSYWTCALSYLATTFYDHVGTAKMGPECDPQAVVDPNLHVYGIKNLRVIDGSIMPTIPSGNLLGPVLMIAEKGSDLIKSEWLQKNQTAIECKNEKVKEPARTKTSTARSKPKAT